MKLKIDPIARAQEFFAAIAKNNAKFNKEKTGKVFGLYTHIPLSVIEDIATSGLQKNDTWVQAVVPNNGINRSCFDGEFNLSYTGDRLHDDYVINFLKHRIEYGSMSNLGERGYGRRMMANRVMVGLVLGLRHMTIEAGHLMGGCVWPKAGIYPGAEYTNFLRDFLKTRLTLLKDRIDPKLYCHLDQLCALEKPDDIRRIAMCSVLANATPQLFNQALSDTRLLTQGWRYQDYEETMPWHIDQMTIGMFLLCGQNYEGHLLFNDHKRMTILENYVGVPLRMQARQFQERYHPTQPTRLARHLLTPGSQKALRR